MAVEQQASDRRRSAEARDELRAAPEVVAVGERIPRRRQARDVGLPDLDVEAGGPQPLGEMALQGGLLARRKIAAGRLRVEGDERRQQIDELSGPALDLVDDALLGRARGHQRAVRRTASSSTARSVSAIAANSTGPAISGGASWMTG